MTVKTALSSIREFAYLNRLFQSTLELRNSNWKDDILELQDMADSLCRDQAKASKIYQNLADSIKHDQGETCAKIRRVSEVDLVVG